LKKKFTVVATAAFILAFAFASITLADDVEVNTPISANQAFDAVANQKDPNTGDDARVALIDVRTSAEYFWVGACAKVNSITTGNNFYEPHNGKVTLKWGSFLSFKVASRRHLREVYVPLHMVESIDTEDISIHVPTHIWIESESTKVENENFAQDIESLSADYDVLILMCRSGKRSNTRAFDTTLFKAIYEIDRPDGSDGYGGFQGSSYGDLYNGYRGYPGRNKWVQNIKSVSWSDTGLPVHIGGKPFFPTPTAGE